MVIEYPGEAGVCLQHLAILIGRESRNRIWPEIFLGSIPIVEELPLRAQTITSANLRRRYGIGRDRLVDFPSRQATF